MKKTLALLSLLIVVLSVAAQDSDIIIGVEASVIRSIPWGDISSDEFTPNNSFSPGISLQYVLSPSFSFKTGTIYERKGWTTALDYLNIDLEPEGTQDFVAHFNYLTLPMLLSYSTKGKVQFYASGGTYFSFLLSSKVTLSETVEFPKQTKDVSEGTKKLDFGISLGCGVYYPIGERYIIDFGIRDHLGLLDIFKIENEDKVSFNTIGIMGSIKYRF